MTLHFRESPDLRSNNILTITERDNLVKGKNQLKAMSDNLFLLKTAAIVGNLFKAKNN
jgi:hypothetical protein